MRAYRHSSHGSSGGSYGGSSGGSYGGSSGGSSGGSYGGSSGGYAYGGSYGGYSSPAYSSGYTPISGMSSSMPVESYRVINEAPAVGTETIGVPASTDSTQIESKLPADAAMLVVEVPAAAKVFVNGSKTSATGGVRRFISRGLAAGKEYEYVVRMVVERDGQASEETKVVPLSAGGRAAVSFKSAESELTIPGAPAAPKTSLTLRVPADAKVWLAGNKTASTGETRLFETTTLRGGQSWKNYEIRVTATVDGREETVSKVIDLAAGDVVELTLDPQQRTASADKTASIR
jgi:uncharacterized protein (TIGR03000 family)